MNHPEKCDLRRRHRCPHCKTDGRPLKRVWGFPTEEAQKRVSQGHISLMGCCLPIAGTWVSAHECRHCQAEWQLGRWFS